MLFTCSFLYYLFSYLLLCKPAYILSCLPICFILTYILMYVLTSLCSYLLAYLPTCYWMMLCACLSLLTIVNVNPHAKDTCRNTLNGTTHPNIKRYNSHLTNWNPCPHKSSHTRIATQIASQTTCIKIIRTCQNIGLCFRILNHQNWIEIHTTCDYISHIKYLEPRWHRNRF
jgi:hypothetical protein